MECCHFVCAHNVAGVNRRNVGKPGSAGAELCFSSLVLVNSSHYEIKQVHFNVNDKPISINSSD